MVDIRPPATVLQFIATKSRCTREEMDREFIIAYYVEDRAFAISERTVPNSGYRGGKFMQKSVVINPKTGQPFQPSEIYIGAELEINSTWFILQEASEDALKVMEARSDVFSKCDLCALMEKLRTQMKGKCPNMLVEFQRLDSRKRGIVSLVQLQQIFSQFDISLEDQEFLTLFRRYQEFDDDRFQYQPFINALV